MLKNYTKIKVDEYGEKQYLNDKGKRHRLDGPAVELASGTKFWYINDKEHRNIDPSREYSNGVRRWFFNNKYHRVGGSCSSFYSEWWYIHGEQYTKKEYFDKVWDI